MKNTLIELVKMTTITFPMYKNTLKDFQEECEYCGHLIEGCELDEAISVVCESQMMVDLYDCTYRTFIENLLLFQISVDKLH